METSTKTSKNETGTLGVLMLIVGGLLMIYAGVSGSIGIFETIVEYAKDYLEPSQASILEMLLIGLGFIAALGGISVLAGVLLIKTEHKGTGKFIIGIGAGMGLIGLILLIVTTVIGGAGLTGAYRLLAGMALGTSGLGVLLTIFGRMRV